MFRSTLVQCALALAGSGLAFAEPPDAPESVTEFKALAPADGADSVKSLFDEESDSAGPFGGGPGGGFVGGFGGGPGGFRSGAGPGVGLGRAPTATPQIGYFVLSKGDRDKTLALINKAQHKAAFDLAVRKASFKRVEARVLCESSVLVTVGIFGSGSEALGSWDAWKDVDVEKTVAAHRAAVRKHHARSFGGDGKQCDATLRHMVEAAKSAARSGQYLHMFGY